MSESEMRKTLLHALCTRRFAELRCMGETYLIQPDNNKGCDYVSVWRTGARPARLGEAMYDGMTGIDEDAVSELLRLPCIQGRSLWEWFSAGEAVWLSA